MSSLYSEAELPGLSAGEIRLKGGRVSGLWKVSRGEGDTVQSVQFTVQYSTQYSTQYTVHISEMFQKSSEF